jgi:multicomponent Na+:H+ antiporter subunit F
VTGAAYLVLSAAFVCFGFRLLRGPTLADRVIAIDGMLMVGLSLLVVQAEDTGRGAFLQVAIMLTLVGFIGTAVVARFIEGQGE